MADGPPLYSHIRLYNKKQDAGVYERRYPLDPEAFIHPDFRGVDPKHPREKEREGFYRRRFYDGEEANF